MPTNLASRFTLIGVILLGALWCVFPGMFKGRLKPDLRPGIDMVGGTSLLYEIKTSDGTTGPAAGNLAEEVMKALKRRVDPDGVRNLIWRPQGNTRLEIQMPLTANSAQSQEKRQAFSDAQKKLQETNVRQGEVLHAVETLAGDARRDKLNQLSMGSEQRSKLFGSLASVWDQLQQARQQKNAATQADLELKY